MNRIGRAMWIAGWVGVLATSSFAKDTTYEIRPNTLALMSFPLQIECTKTSSGELGSFNVIAPVATAPSHLNGEIKVQRGSRVLFSAAVAPTELSGMQSWSFYLGSELLEGATFTLSQSANPSSVRSWVLHLQPLVADVLKPVDNHGQADRTAPPMSMGRETMGQYWRCRLGPKYAWNTNATN